MNLPVFIRRVQGRSMLPTLKSGSIVVGLRMLKPKVGAIVIARVGEREIVKRVAITNGTKLFLTGDNDLESTDSRSFGWLNRNQIVGSVIWPQTG